MPGLLWQPQSLSPCPIFRWQQSHWGLLLVLRCLNAEKLMEYCKLLYVHFEVFSSLNFCDHDLIWRCHHGSHALFFLFLFRVWLCVWIVLYPVAVIKLEMFSAMLICFLKCQLSRRTSQTGGMSTFQKGSNTPSSPFSRVSALWFQLHHFPFQRVTCKAKSHRNENNIR